MTLQHVNMCPHHCDTPCPIQELLPNLLHLMQRGRGGGPVLTILEAYLLLGQGAGMEPHMPLMATAMQRVLAVAAAGLQGQEDRPGRLSPEAANDLVVVASLLTLMQQVCVRRRVGCVVFMWLLSLLSLLLLLLCSVCVAGGCHGECPSCGSCSPIYLCAITTKSHVFISHTITQLPLQQHLAAFEPVFRAMAEMVALQSDEMLDMGFAVQSVSDSFFEVLGKLLCMQPAAITALLPDPAAQSALIDRWLRLSMTRTLQEVLRMPGVAAVGRFRRHLAAYALSTLIVADTTPALRDTATVCVCVGGGDVQQCAFCHHCQTSPLLDRLRVSCRWECVRFRKLRSLRVTCSSMTRWCARRTAKRRERTRWC